MRACRWPCLKGREEEGFSADSLVRAKDREWERARETRGRVKGERELEGKLRRLQSSARKPPSVTDAAERRHRLHGEDLRAEKYTTNRKREEVWRRPLPSHNSQSRFVPSGCTSSSGAACGRRPEEGRIGPCLL